MSTTDELLTVASAARQLGIAPATLRTWDRRYGLGPSSHETGAHRRYSQLDIAKLMEMRRLISIGVAPCDAAEKAKLYKGKKRIEKINHEFESREELAKAIYRAANNFDKAFVKSELRKDLAKHGVDSTWSQVIAPLLYLVGKNWEENGAGIEVEHLLSEIIQGVLQDSVIEIKDPLNPRPVLLAAVGEELHCLALHALAAALAERRIATHFLGARTPLLAISGMVSRSAPPAVFLWAQLEENADPEFFRDLPAIRPAPRIVLGGPGWDRIERTGVVFAQDIFEACLEIERAVGL